MQMVRQPIQERPRVFRRFDPRGRTPREAFSRTLLDAPRIPDEGTRKLWSAYGIAERIFQGRTRKDGKTPAIFHTLAVDEYALSLLRGNQHAGCVALLHDCTEDGQKYGFPLHHQDIIHRFDFRIARDVDLLTNPKCAKKDPNGTHRWVVASDKQYAHVQEVYTKENPMPPEVYLEMREFYLNRMLCAEGIRAFCIKLCDAMSNLEDIENLAPDRRERKLKENMVFIELAARLHWRLYEFMAESLEEWGYTVPDLCQAIAVQERQGVIMLPARSELNPEMVRQLPIRHPDSTSFTRNELPLINQTLSTFIASRNCGVAPILVVGGLATRFYTDSNLTKTAAVYATDVDIVISNLPAHVRGHLDVRYITSFREVVMGARGIITTERMSDLSFFAFKEGAPHPELQGVDIFHTNVGGTIVVADDFRMAKTLLVEHALGPVQVNLPDIGLLFAMIGRPDAQKETRVRRAVYVLATWPEEAAAIGRRYGEVVKRGFLPGETEESFIKTFRSFERLSGNARPTIDRFINTAKRELGISS